MRQGAAVLGGAMMAAAALAALPARAQDAPPDAAPVGWLDAMPAGELTPKLLIARKIEARCRGLRLSDEAEATIERRAPDLSAYLTERRLGPSAASQPAISAFEARHQTTYSGTNSLCRAGFVEMKDSTDIGRLLQAR